MLLVSQWFDEKPWICVEQSPFLALSNYGLWCRDFLPPRVKNTYGEFCSLELSFPEETVPKFRGYWHTDDGARASLTADFHKLCVHIGNSKCYFWGLRKLLNFFQLSLIETKPEGAWWRKQQFKNKNHLIAYVYAIWFTENYEHCYCWDI